MDGIKSLEIKELARKQESILYKKRVNTVRTKSEAHIGKTIKNFKILDTKRVRNEKKGISYFFIECLLCGNKKWMETKVVLNCDRTVGCGCLRNKDKALKINTGEIYGRLRVVRVLDQRINGSIAYECECECGNVTRVGGAYLKSGHTKSCGCLNDEQRNRHYSVHIKSSLVEGTNLLALKSKKLKENNTSGVTGVSRRKTKSGDRWDAKIGFQGKTIHLGSFTNKEDAIRARERGVEKYHKPILDKYKDKR